MKILTRKKQIEALKLISHIMNGLVSEDEEERSNALCSCVDLSFMLGGLNAFLRAQKDEKK